MRMSSLSDISRGCLECQKAVILESGNLNCGLEEMLQTVVNDLPAMRE